MKIWDAYKQNRQSREMFLVYEPQVKKKDDEISSICHACVSILPIEVFVYFHLRRINWSTRPMDTRSPHLPPSRFFFFFKGNIYIPQKSQGKPCSRLHEGDDADHRSPPPHRRERCKDERVLQRPSQCLGCPALSSIVRSKQERNKTKHRGSNPTFGAPVGGSEPRALENLAASRVMLRERRGGSYIARGGGYVR